MGIINITNRVGYDGVKAIIVSSTGYDCTVDPPTIDYNTTLYHKGIGEFPIPGDAIFKNKQGTLPYTSADEPFDRQIRDNNENLKVDAFGIMIITC